MMYFNRFFFLLILLFAIRFLCFPTNNHTLKSITENERQRVNSFFTENKGQVGFYGPNENINILFYSQTRGLNYYITSKGISYCFFNVKDEPREKFLKIRKLFKREPQNKEL